MNWLDVVFLAIFLWSIAAGAAKGLARVTVGLAATILGVLFASRWYAEAGGYLREYVSSPAVAQGLGFLLILVLFVAAGGLVSLTLSAVFRWAGVTWLDRLLGATFGLLRALLLAIAIVMIGMAFPKQTLPHAIERSRIAPYIAEAAAVLSAITPPELKDSFRANYDEVKRSWSKAVGNEPRRTVEKYQ
jgi:membrane protein required for colicin V production